MASENIVMSAVKKAATAELHEKIRVCAQQAAKVVKEEGAAKTTSSSASAPTPLSGWITRRLRPSSSRRTSRTQRRTGGGIPGDCIRPLLEENRALLGEKAELGIIRWENYQKPPRYATKRRSGFLCKRDKAAGAPFRWRGKPRADDLAGIDDGDEGAGIRPADVICAGETASRRFNTVVMTCSSRPEKAPWAVYTVAPRCSVPMMNSLILSGWRDTMVTFFAHVDAF